MRWSIFLILVMWPACRDGRSPADGGDDVLGQLHDAYIDGTSDLVVRHCECFFDLMLFEDVDHCLAAQQPISVTDCEVEALRSDSERYERFLLCHIEEIEERETCLETCPTSPEACVPTGEPAETCSALLSQAQLDERMACFR